MNITVKMPSDYSYRQNILHIEILLGREYERAEGGRKIKVRTSGCNGPLSFIIFLSIWYVSKSFILFLLKFLCPLNYEFRNCKLLFLFT